MARTLSSMMLALGATAPDFCLPDITQQGQQVTRNNFAGRVMVVMFICNHCPYVKHLRAGLVAYARDYQPQGVGIAAINANDVQAYPQDNPAAMAAEATAAGYTFAYLHDETQAVARAYFATCTPDFFVFDRQHHLVYRGQFDAARPGNDSPVTGGDLRRATDAALQNRPPLLEQKPSIGCNIKWKPGQQPTFLPPSAA